MIISNWRCLNYKEVVEVGVTQVGGASEEDREDLTCSG